MFAEISGRVGILKLPVEGCVQVQVNDITDEVSLLGSHWAFTVACLHNYADSHV